jgi:pimeloyl-ACP methyl ester carboxylesterase
VAAAVLLACWGPGVAFAAGNPRQGEFSGQISIGGGRKLYLRCAGRGSPTVVMDAGLHESSDSWTLTQTAFPVPSSPSVFQGVARFTHACIYDRPGTIRQSPTQPPAVTTRSTPVPMPRKLPNMAADLHKLLMSAGIRAPIVLVGHSVGGLINLYFAQTYRREVRGIVLVDALGTAIKRLLGPLWPRYARLVNFPGGPLQNMPGWETLDVDGAFRAVQGAKPLPRMPLAVISKTEPFGVPGLPNDFAIALEKAWAIMQDRLVSLEPQTPHILATGSDHNIQIHDPDLTTSVIRLIWDRVRARHEPWPS